MPFQSRSEAGHPELVKTHAAIALRERILRGELKPGEIISETQWGPRLGVAQASVREALNLLATEGLVQKEPGRSARVTRLTQRNVVQAYQVRAVLEGLAARLVTEQQPDLGDLDRSIRDMKASAERGDLRTAIEADMRFHLRLCEMSGNLVLLQQARQLLIPFFAFSLIRALGNKESTKAWLDGVDDHLLVLAGIRSKDPAFAEQSTRHAISTFVAVARELWAGEEPGLDKKRSLRIAGG